jgi:hypothetical protein
MDSLYSYFVKFNSYVLENCRDNTWTKHTIGSSIFLVKVYILPIGSAFEYMKVAIGKTNVDLKKIELLTFENII